MTQFYRNEWGQIYIRIREEVKLAAFEITSEHFPKRDWAKHTKFLVWTYFEFNPLKYKLHPTNATVPVHISKVITIRCSVYSS
jgi:hypothetical protein